MSLSLLGAFLLASTVAEKPRFVSPNGEMVVVVRHAEAEPGADSLPDLVLLPDETYPEPKPKRGALYHVRAGGYRELLAEFVFRPGENVEDVLVTNDGHVITHQVPRCDAAAELLTIRDASAAVVRTLRARDVMTAHDQQWHCRGGENDIRYSIDGATLRMAMLVTDGRWEDAAARHHTVDIELPTGDAPKPDRDHCPPVTRIIAEGDDALLRRAIVRVTPEFPEIATKARITGRVIVEVVVGRDGKVESAKITKPLPFGLDEAVQDAIMKWEFTPDETPMSGALLFRFEILRNFPPVVLSCH